jgi:hypothetical protein
MNGADVEVKGAGSAGAWRPGFVGLAVGVAGRHACSHGVEMIRGIR